MLTLARICLHKGVSVPGVPYLTLFGPIIIMLLAIIISQPPFIKGLAIYILNKK